MIARSAMDMTPLPMGLVRILISPREWPGDRDDDVNSGRS